MTEIRFPVLILRSGDKCPVCEHRIGLNPEVDVIARIDNTIRNLSSPILSASPVMRGDILEDLKVLREELLRQKKQSELPLEKK